MRVVTCVAGWDGIATAQEALSIVEESWTLTTPGIEIVSLAVGDGGPRTVDAMAGPRLTIDRVTAVETHEGLVVAPAGGALRWEPTSLALALHRIAQDTTLPRRVIVPVGDEPPAGDAADLWGASLEDAKAALADLEIIALVTSDRPLLGFHGMSAAVREGRESDAALAVAAQDQEERWRVRAAEADELIAARSLLAGPRRLSDQPRTGAAGGLAYCLAALGARLEPAAHALTTWAGLPEAVESADLVVGVVGTLSHAALDHGVAAPVGGLAAARGVPAVVLAVESQVGRRDLMAAGIHGTHCGGAGVAGLAGAARRAARTWTPAR